MGKYVAGRNTVTLIMQIVVVGLLISVLYYLYKIFKLVQELKAMGENYRNVNQGLHSAYSIEEVEKEALECRMALDEFQRNGGELKISTDWLKALIAKGNDIGSIIGEANRHAELGREYERHQNRYMFMLQANIDFFRGIKTANELYEEEKEIFTGSGLWGYIGVNMIEKGRKYDDWIRKNYDLLKTA